MKTVNAEDKATVEQLLKLGGEEPVLVLQQGHAVAMLMPFDDDDLEWYARERDPKFIESIARAREQARTGQIVSHDALKAEFGLK